MLLAANTKMLWSYFYDTSKDAQIDTEKKNIFKLEI